MRHPFVLLVLALLGAVEVTVAGGEHEQAVYLKK